MELAKKEKVKKLLSSLGSRAIAIQMESEPRCACCDQTMQSSREIRNMICDDCDCEYVYE